MNNNIISFFLNLDPSVYILFLGGAVGVSLLTQWAKKIFDLTNEKHVVAVFNLIALAAAGLQYFLSASNLPPYILGINTLVLTGIAQPLYIYVIKPLSIFISNVQAYKQSVLNKVEDINSVATAPVVTPVVTTTTVPTTVVTPAEGATVPTTVNTPVDSAQVAQF